MKYYYKIVCVLNDKRVSCIMGNRNDETSLEYKEGEWTKPKIKKSKILIFENYACARNFYHKNIPFTSNTREIWQVIAWGKVKRDIKIINCIATIQNIIEAWFYGNADYSSPNGTLGASKIKLIKKLL